MAKKQIIDIDAEFDGVEFDERAINVATGSRKTVAAREANGWAEKNKKARDKVNSDPTVHKNRTEANQRNAKDPDWIAKNARGVEKRKQSITWKQNHAEAMKKVHANPNLAENRRKGVEQKTLEDPDWILRRNENSAKAKFKPLVTCEGIFDSLKSASEHYAVIWKISVELARVRLMRKKNKPGQPYYNITQEEYTKLTGKTI